MRINQTANRTLLRASVAGIALFAALAVARPAAAQFLYTFDSDAQGWAIGSRPNGGGNPELPPNGPLTPNLAATLAHSPTGGNPGGHLRATDTGGGDMVLFRNFAGGIDLSSVLGGTFRFDAIQLAATTSNYAPFGRVRFYRNDNASVDLAAFDIVSATNQPPASWTTYSAAITTGNFAVSSSSGFNLAQILSSVSRIEITVESVQGFEETVGVDNIGVRASAPEPGVVALLLAALPTGFALLRRRA